MIMARMDGGLGNQMFQYAYGLYLACKHNTELILDVGSYQARPQHGFLLDRFCVEARCAERSEISRIPGRYRPERQWALSDWWPGHTLQRHKEAPFGFQPKHLKVPNDRYLVGYWQSENFFPGLRTELIKQFALCQPLSDPSRAVAERIGSTNSLAVHVRRGDYVTSSAATKIYCNLEPAYYLASIRDWAENHSSPEVFVFSNDITWCRQHLQLPWPTTFVDHNHADTAHEDLYLMSQAQGCVIANSTFSWWAAWLDERPGKVVYAPTGLVPTKHARRLTHPAQELAAWFVGTALPCG